MSKILSKFVENMGDKVADIIWLAIKTIVITAIILLLLRVIPITINNNERIGIWQEGTWRVDTY